MRFSPKIDFGSFLGLREENLKKKKNYSKGVPGDMNFKFLTVDIHTNSLANPRASRHNFQKNPEKPLINRGVQFFLSHL